jgi:ribosomal protein L11 methyltransferase
MNDSSKWISVFVPAESATAEAVQNFLFELGASGTEECPDGVRAYFPSEAFRREPLDTYLRELRALGFSVEEPSYAELPRQDWGEKWREGFKPVSVTGRIVVKPPWESGGGPDSVVIDIYPRMAFGTGTHETTQICLRFIERHAFPGCRVLDLGTGSGILAIAAAKFGADRVLAVDPDPDAIDNAVENVRINGVEARVTVKPGTLETLTTGEGPDDPNDLILANLDRPTLKSVIPRLAPFLRPGGTAFLSGILDVEKELVGEMLDLHGWRILETVSMGEWVGMACRRREGA